MLVMAMRVVDARRIAGVSIGDGDDPMLKRRMRGQANLAEYGPIGLILLAVAEIQGAAPWLLLPVAFAFICARAIHAYAFGFSDNLPKLRYWGTTITFLAIALLAITNLLLPLF